jgi:hypothetical protein
MTIKFRYCHVRSGSVRFGHVKLSYIGLVQVSRRYVRFVHVMSGQNRLIKFRLI